jgi:hypothetical protein
MKDKKTDINIDLMSLHGGYNNKAMMTSDYAPANIVNVNGHFLL